MANIKSQIKRNRQNDKKRLRNRVFRGEARIAVRNARTTMEEGVPESKAALLEAISALDKAAEQGVIHKNNAARRKSRLMKAYAKMGPVKVEAESMAQEPVLAAELTTISSPKGKKKAAPKGKAASKKIVEEPKAEAAEVSKAEPKKSSPKTKAAAKSSSKAKKAVAEKIETTPSPKSKKPETTSSPKGKTTSTRTSSPKGKKPAAKK